ncbi:hypothetical protein HDV00_008455 [Rhizophlyctis rosea]|nr:hypothetical protein HDV00_008455 [Rhizophlyctis rosea]
MSSLFSPHAATSVQDLLGSLVSLNLDTTPLNAKFMDHERRLAALERAEEHNKSTLASVVSRQDDFGLGMGTISKNTNEVSQRVSAVSNRLDDLHTNLNLTLRGMNKDNTAQLDSVRSSIEELRTFLASANDSIQILKKSVSTVQQDVRVTHSMALQARSDVWNSEVQSSHRFDSIHAQMNGINPSRPLWGGNAGRLFGVSLHGTSEGLDSPVSPLKGKGKKRVRMGDERDEEEYDLDGRSSFEDEDGEDIVMHEQEVVSRPTRPLKSTKIAKSVAVEVDNNSFPITGTSPTPIETDPELDSHDALSPRRTNVDEEASAKTPDGNNPNDKIAVAVAAQGIGLNATRPPTIPTPPTPSRLSFPAGIVMGAAGVAAAVLAAGSSSS